MVSRIPRLPLPDAQSLVQSGRGQITVESNKRNGCTVHEVSLNSDVHSVFGEVLPEIFATLLLQDGVKVATLLFPGMAPYRALVSVSDPIAYDYEVEIRYKNRPDDSIDY